MTTKLAKAKNHAYHMQASQRQIRQRMRVLQKSHDALLSALLGLLNEQQPLGIDRPTYQTALKATSAAEEIR